jgi:hypothetical protein
VYQTQFDKYKSMPDVIAASMKFAGDGEPDATSPPNESSEAKEPAVPAPDEPPAEKAPAEKDPADGAKADQ